MELVFQENGSFAFTGAASCPGCSRVIGDSVVDPGFELVVPTFDVSVTNDGAVIVTDAFVDACDDAPGARFDSVGPGIAVMWVETVVHIEPFASGVASGPECTECGAPRYRVRRGAIRLDGDEVVPDGFCRTDLEFGDTADFGPEQPVAMRPHLLVDRSTGRRLKDAALIGVHLITQS